jgi:hypothetical protein
MNLLSGEGSSEVRHDRQADRLLAAKDGEGADDRGDAGFAKGAARGLSTSRAWLARVKSEIELWSELATKLAATRSAPEAMEIYQQCIAQRTQMAAEDWQRLSEDFQRFTQTATRSPSNGRSLGGT